MLSRLELQLLLLDLAKRSTCKQTCSSGSIAAITAGVPLGTDRLFPTVVIDCIPGVLSETMALTVAGPTNPEAVGECCKVEREDELGEVLLLSWRRR